LPQDFLHPLDDLRRLEDHFLAEGFHLFAARGVKMQFIFDVNITCGLIFTFLTFLLPVVWI